MDEEKSAQPTVAVQRRKLATSVAATLVLGAIGSGIWEVAFRPGLSTLGELFAHLSTRFSDEIYASAALDPQPLPGLVALLLLAGAPFFFAIYFFQRGFVEPPLRRAIRKKFREIEASAESLDEHHRKLTRLLRLVSTIGIVLFAVVGCMTFVGFTLQNESTKVWRIFNSNVEVLAPAVKPEGVAVLRASFRQMKKKDDFTALKAQMDKQASISGVVLTWYGL